jgi:putative addiction module CopG family antidote
MTALKVTLPEPLDRFVADQVASGAYADPEDVIRASLRRFKTQSEAETERRARFFEAVQIGLDEAERGEVIPVTDVRAFLDEIDAEIDAEFADRAA